MKKQLSTTKKAPTGLQLKHEKIRMLTSIDDKRLAAVQGGADCDGTSYSGHMMCAD